MSPNEISGERGNRYRHAHKVWVHLHKKSHMCLWYCKLNRTDGWLCWLVPAFFISIFWISTVAAICYWIFSPAICGFVNSLFAGPTVSHNYFYERFFSTHNRKFFEYGVKSHRICHFFLKNMYLWKTNTLLIGRCLLGRPRRGLQCQQGRFLTIRTVKAARL